MQVGSEDSSVHRHPSFLLSPAFFLDFCQSYQALLRLVISQGGFGLSPPSFPKLSKSFPLPLPPAPLFILRCLLLALSMVLFPNIYLSYGTVRHYFYPQ